MDGTKGLKNVIWGILAQIITIGLGILIPRLVLVNLGSEANGLLNSVGSVLAYMSLLEAGVGTATLQALYKPLGSCDKQSVNRIMAATDSFYKRTGTVYLMIVLILSASYSGLVDSSMSRMSVFLVVLLAGLSGVISYFFQGKYRILLSAEGKGYITTNISTICSVGVSVAKAAILILGANVVLVQIVYFVFNLLKMLIIMLYIRKNYSWLNLNITPDFEALAQRKAVLIHQITELIFNNTDVIILTAFTTLKTVSVYSMYAMIFGMVKSVAVTFSDGFLYVLGQSYGNKEKFIKYFNVFEIYNMAITFALFCISAILMLPFLKLYTSGVNDINYIDKKVLILFVLFYLLQNGRKASQTVINIAQHFEQTKWRTITEAAINLISSIVLTYKLGIYGVLLGTVVALLYRTNDVIFYAAKLLERSVWVTYRRWLTNGTIFLTMIFLFSKVSVHLDTYFQMIKYGVFLSVTIIPVFMIINSLAEPQSAKYAYNVLKNILSEKIKSQSAR